MTIFYLQLFFTSFVCLITIFSVDGGRFEQDKTDLQSKLSFDKFIHGTLDASTVSLMAQLMKDSEVELSSFPDDLSWLATHTHFFSFESADNISIQAYHIPRNFHHDLELEDSELSSSEHVGINNGLVVFLCGWTETIIKYAKFVRELNRLGYEVFSYDFRGQGFSEHTGFDKGKVTHSESFLNVVDDLHIFMTEIIPNRMKTNIPPPTCYAHNDSSDSSSSCLQGDTDTSMKSKSTFYIGNSFGSLVGLFYETLHPGNFSRIVTISPLIETISSPLLKLAAKLLRGLGFGTKLSSRLNPEITSLTHDTGKFQAWKMLREIAADQIKIQGMSISMGDEIHQATAQLRKKASLIKTPVLILQASSDDMVNNNAISSFVLALTQSPVVYLIRFKDSYHELLIETDPIFTSIVFEVHSFLKKELVY